MSIYAHVHISDKESGNLKGLKGVFPLKTFMHVISYIISNKILIRNHKRKKALLGIQWVQFDREH